MKDFTKCYIWFGLDSADRVVIQERKEKKDTRLIYGKRRGKHWLRWEK